MKAKDRIANVTKLLDSKKAMNIEVINMVDSEYIFDYVIIATMLNSKHGFSMLDYLKQDLKPKGEEFLYIQEGDDWIVIDLGDMLIHLMNNSYREIYQIELFLEEIKQQK